MRGVGKIPSRKNPDVVCVGLKQQIRTVLLAKEHPTQGGRRNVAYACSHSTGLPSTYACAILGITPIRPFRGIIIRVISTVIIG